MVEGTAEIPEVNIDVAKERVKPRLEALLLADYASVTINGKPDICGVFDEFSVDPEKKNTGFFFLYIRTVETTEAGIDISIFDPNGNLHGKGTAEMVATDSQVEKRRLSVLQRLALETPIEGEYWIDVSYKGQSLGGTFFTVKYQGKAENNDSISG